MGNFNGSVTLHTKENYEGKSYICTQDLPSFKGTHENNDVSSATVASGTWQIFTDEEYKGKSVTLSAHGGPKGDGYYPNAECMGGLNNKFSSIQIVESAG